MPSADRSSAAPVRPVSPQPAHELPPGVAEAHLIRAAEQVDTQLCEQEALWNKGFTRRSFIAGAGMAGVAALGTQLVTSKVSYASAATTNNRTVITVFLRGAADGLRILVPASPDLGVNYLHQVRPNLIPTLTALNGGWALNSAMAPLMPFWATNELAFVPAVSAAGISRSHFEAQQLLEHGGVATASDGWLDRALRQLGPGTTFRAVSRSSAVPASLAGSQNALGIGSLENFTFPGWSGVTPRAESAVRSLYRGVSGPLGQDVPLTLAALGTAAKARKNNKPHNGAKYPSGNFGAAMADLATLLRSEVGMQVATVDVGGWDTHTNEANQLDAALTSAAKTLAAFMTDLGPARRSRVTVVVMTEFGRRVAMNASGGTDHGHGSVMWLLGGGLTRSGVYGRWSQLNSSSLDQGDVPGWNSAFDTLGEVLRKRLGIGRLDLIFPRHGFAFPGVVKTT